MTGSQSVSPFWTRRDDEDWHLMMGDDVVGSLSGGVTRISARVPDTEHDRVNQILDRLREAQTLENDVLAGADLALDREVRKLTSLVHFSPSDAERSLSFSDVNETLNAWGALSSASHVQRTEAEVSVMISDPDNLKTECLFSVKNKSGDALFVGGRVDGSTAETLFLSFHSSLSAYKDKAVLSSLKFQKSDSIPVPELIATAYGGQDAGYSADTKIGHLDILPAEVKGQVRVRLNGVILSDVQLDLIDGTLSLKLHSPCPGVNADIMFNVMASVFIMDERPLVTLTDDQFSELLRVYLDSTEEDKDFGWLQELNEEEIS